MNKKEIEQQIHEFAEKMYQAGYADGNNTNLIDKAYQEGLKDAWECLKEIVYPIKEGGLSAEDVKEIFGTVTVSRILRDNPPSIAIQKIEDWEKKQKQKQNDKGIRIGDEVYVVNKNYKSVVTSIYGTSHGPVAMLLSGDAKWIEMELEYLNKTGKHYDAIEEVLKELRGDEE